MSTAIKGGSSNFKNTRGTTDLSLNKEVSTALPERVTVETELFEGSRAPVKLPVDVCFEEEAGKLTVWFESPEMRYQQELAAETYLEETLDVLLRTNLVKNYLWV